MRTIGKITLADLDTMKRRGLAPQEAVDALLAEAKARNPRAESIHIVKSNLHTGFDLVAL